jgi:hypothetical protein
MLEVIDDELNDLICVSLNWPIAVSSSGVGITPASLSAVGFTRIITFMAKPLTVQ